MGPFLGPPVLWELNSHFSHWILSTLFFSLPALIVRDLPRSCAGYAMLWRRLAASAFKFAKATRILFCGWDESTKFGDAVLAINFTVEHEDGTREDLCLRGLSQLAEGGTSAAVLKHIETNIFAYYSRRMLTLWMKAHEEADEEGRPLHPL